ncbi:MAG TPA: rod shape-determining protein MreC [Bacteroidia bacterium]|nr:rod shape-determining protein MreC [Bacteroidia bacterium]
MKNLVTFIWKHHFFFLFALLEGFSIFLIVQNTKFQRAGIINSSNKVAGFFYSLSSQANEYLNLKNTNQNLASENARLHNLLLSSFILTKAQKYWVNDSLYNQKYKYISAKVVNNSTNQRNNYLTLQAGSLEGVKANMGVISGSGIIGIVKNVSKNYCSVMSVLHKETKISVMIKKFGAFGPLSWDGTDYRFATLSDIPGNIKLQKGDTIVTSAYTGIFPEGVLAGTIESFTTVPGESFFKVKVKLSSNFKSISSYVFVVENVMKDEQDSLEKVSQNAQ